MDCITLSMSCQREEYRNIQDDYGEYDGEHFFTGKWTNGKKQVNVYLDEMESRILPLLMWSTHWSESGRRGKMLKHLPMRSWACIIGILKELMESLR